MSRIRAKAVIQSWIFLAYFLIQPGLVHADECLAHGQIRFREKGTVRVEPASYCFGEDAESLRSSNCPEAGLRPGVSSLESCEIQKAILASFNRKTPVPLSGSGLCDRICGVFQLIEFEVRGRWFETCRCYFERDQSFLDVIQALELRSRPYP